MTKLRRPLAGTRVHFLGIGGVGQAALAELLLAMGYFVSGSDTADQPTVRRLQRLGARVRIGAHSREETEGADHVVVSNAVPGDDPAVARARELGLDVLARAELLALLFECGRGVAVSGTHGKTTTTAMLGLALDGASFLVGGTLNGLGTGARLGDGDILVAEADEAFGTFLRLHPELAVVTSVDLDHTDFYASRETIDEAFVTFLSARSGPAVLCADDPGVRRIRGRVAGDVATYGFAGDDLTIAPDRSLRWRGRSIGHLSVLEPGRHNLLNAAGATAAALLLGADAGTVLASIRAFPGVDRRFSVRGERGGVRVVDDYAHNPAKVEAALSAAREAYPGARIIALFQPHTYTRTRDLAAAFGPAFAGADVLVVTDVYGSRERPIEGVDGRLVADAARLYERPAVVEYVPLLDDAAEVVAALAEAGDVVLTLGAGDVTSAAPKILELLEAR